MDRVKVLCVDDEPHVLEGLALQLRRQFEVTPACGGVEGLKALQDSGPFAVVLSDMQMPGMNGALFLARARQLAPDTTRMLLTGHADVQAAISAVNQGQIFRFLTKPCPPEDLRMAFQAAAEQYRLVTAERVLLEQTLLGSIKSLTDILAMTSPLVFGRANRVVRIAKRLADEVGLVERWPLEAAAMLFQLGYVSISEETARKQHSGVALNTEEQAAVARAPQITQDLLSNIPRLEPVREVLSLCLNRAGAGAQPATSSESVQEAAALLRVAIDFDELESQGVVPTTALDTMRSRQGVYSAKALNTLEAHLGRAEARRQVRETSLRGLTEGMVLAEDVRTPNGVLVIARGFRLTAGFLERARNFPKGHVREPVRVWVDAADE